MDDLADSHVPVGDLVDHHVPAENQVSHYGPMDDQDQANDHAPADDQVDNHTQASTPAEGLNLQDHHIPVKNLEEELMNPNQLSHSEIKDEDQVIDHLQTR